MRNGAVLARDRFETNASLIGILTNQRYPSTRARGDATSGKIQRHNLKSVNTRVENWLSGRIRKYQTTCVQSGLSLVSLKRYDWSLYWNLVLILSRLVEASCWFWNSPPNVTRVYWSGRNPLSGLLDRLVRSVGRGLHLPALYSVLVKNYSRKPAGQIVRTSGWRWTLTNNAFVERIWSFLELAMHSSRDRQESVCLMQPFCPTFGCWYQVDGCGWLNAREWM